MDIITSNKKAHFNYYISDTYTAGLVLAGSEVKSLRAKNARIDESFIIIRNNEAYLKNAYIKPYEKTNVALAPDAHRDRKLLLNKSEIIKLNQKTSEKGFTLIPLKMFFLNGLVKIDIGVAKGKHTYDKKQTLKEKDIIRSNERAV